MPECLDVGQDCSLGLVECCSPFVCGSSDLCCSENNVPNGCATNGRDDCCDSLAVCTNTQYGNNLCCRAENVQCENNLDCCSGGCSPDTYTCFACLGWGETCTADWQCCDANMNCNDDGVCGDDTCTGFGQTGCSTDGCCNIFGDALPITCYLDRCCLDNGRQCVYNSDCCSMLCEDDVCKPQMCEVTPTVPTSIDITADPANEELSIFLFTQNMDTYEKQPVQNGLIFMVDMSDKEHISICYNATGEDGRMAQYYNPQIDGCLDYQFIYCPLAGAVNNLFERELCLNSTGLEKSLIATPPDACGGMVPSTITSHPEQILSFNVFFYCNQMPADYAPLCWPLLLILGLLLGANFAAGRNPFQSFDMSSPRMGRGRRYSARVQNKSFDALTYVFGAMTVGKTAKSAAKAMKGDKKETPSDGKGGGKGNEGGKDGGNAKDAKDAKEKEPSRLEKYANSTDAKTLAGVFLRKVAKVTNKAAKAVKKTVQQVKDAKKPEEQTKQDASKNPSSPADGSTAQSTLPGAGTTNTIPVGANVQGVNLSGGGSISRLTPRKAHGKPPATMVARAPTAKVDLTAKAKGDHMTFGGKVLGTAGKVGGAIIGKSNVFDNNSNSSNALGESGKKGETPQLPPGQTGANLALMSVNTLGDIRGVIRLLTGSKANRDAYGKTADTELFSKLLTGFQGDGKPTIGMVMKALFMVMLANAGLKGKNEDGSLKKGLALFRKDSGDSDTSPEKVSFLEIARSLFQIYAVLSVVSSSTRSLGAATSAKTLKSGFVDNLNSNTALSQKIKFGGSELGVFKMSIGDLMVLQDQSLRGSLVGGGLPYPLSALTPLLSGGKNSLSLLFQKLRDNLKKDVQTVGEYSDGGNTSYAVANWGKENETFFVKNGAGKYVEITDKNEISAAKDAYAQATGWVAPYQPMSLMSTSTNSVIQPINIRYNKKNDTYNVMIDAENKRYDKQQAQLNEAESKAALNGLFIGNVQKRLMKLNEQKEKLEDKEEYKLYKNAMNEGASVAEAAKISGGRIENIVEKLENIKRKLGKLESYYQLSISYGQLAAAYREQAKAYSSKEPDQAKISESSSKIDRLKDEIADLRAVQDLLSSRDSFAKAIDAFVQGANGQANLEKELSDAKLDLENANKGLKDKDKTPEQKDDLRVKKWDAKEKVQETERALGVFQLLNDAGISSKDMETALPDIKASSNFLVEALLTDIRNQRTEKKLESHGVLINGVGEPAAMPAVMAISVDDLKKSITLATTGDRGILSGIGLNLTDAELEGAKKLQGMQISAIFASLGISPLSKTDLESINKEKMPVSLNLKEDQISLLKAGYATNIEGFSLGGKEIKVPNLAVKYENGVVSIFNSDPNKQISFSSNTDNLTLKQQQDRLGVLNTLLMAVELTSTGKYGDMLLAKNALPMVTELKNKMLYAGAEYLNIMGLDNVAEKDKNTKLLALGKTISETCDVLMSSLTFSGRFSAQENVLYARLQNMQKNAQMLEQQVNSGSSKVKIDNYVDISNGKVVSSTSAALFYIEKYNNENDGTNKFTKPIDISPEDLKTAFEFLKDEKSFIFEGKDGNTYSLVKVKGGAKLYMTETTVSTAVEQYAKNMANILDDVVSLHKTSDAFLETMMTMAMPSYMYQAPYRSKPIDDALEATPTPGQAKDGARDFDSFTSTSSAQWFASYSNAKYKRGSEFKFKSYDWTIGEGEKPKEREKFAIERMRPREAEQIALPSAPETLELRVRYDLSNAIAYVQSWDDSAISGGKRKSWDEYKDRATSYDQADKNVKSALKYMMDRQMITAEQLANNHVTPQQELVLFHLSQTQYRLPYLKNLRASQGKDPDPYSQYKNVDDLAKAVYDPATGKSEVSTIIAEKKDNQQWYANAYKKLYDRLADKKQ